MIELTGGIPKKLCLSGKYSRDFFNRHGELKHIKDLRVWPLDRVLVDKYDFPPEEAHMVSSFLTPLLQMNMGSRMTAEAAMQHPYIRHWDVPLEKLVAAAHAAPRRIGAADDGADIDGDDGVYEDGDMEGGDDYDGEDDGDDAGVDEEGYENQPQREAFAKAEEVRQWLAATQGLLPPTQRVRAHSADVDPRLHAMMDELSIDDSVRDVDVDSPVGRSDLLAPPEEPNATESMASLRDALMDELAHMSPEAFDEMPEDTKQLFEMLIRQGLSEEQLAELGVMGELDESELVYMDDEDEMGEGEGAMGEDEAQYWTTRLRHHISESQELGHTFDLDELAAAEAAAVQRLGSAEASVRVLASVPDRRGSSSSAASAGIQSASSAASVMSERMQQFIASVTARTSTLTEVPAEAPITATAHSPSSTPGAPRRPVPAPLMPSPLQVDAAAARAGGSRPVPLAFDGKAPESTGSADAFSANLASEVRFDQEPARRPRDPQLRARASLEQRELGIWDVDSSEDESSSNGTQ